MGNGIDNKNPYEALAAKMQARKQDFLRRITDTRIGDEAEKAFEAELGTTVTAKRRGFLRGRHYGHAGRRPTANDPMATNEGLELAKWRTDDDHLQAVWYDTPALRRDPGNLLDDENVYMTVARLVLYEQAAERIKKRPGAPKPLPFTVPFPQEPIPLDQPVVRLADLINQAASIGVWIPDKAQAALERAAVIKNAKTKDGTPLVVAIIEALHKEVEKPKRFSSGDRPNPLSVSIARILPPDLVDELYVAISPEWDLAFLWEANKTPSKELSYAINLLACLGSIVGMPLRAALRAVANCLLTGFTRLDLKEQWLQSIEESPFAFAVIFRRPNVILPPGWQWPSWNAEGIYWWRAVLLECVDELLAYHDTADFHANKLLRLFYLQRGFKHVSAPPYVRTDIELTLKYFKYWIDEPPQSQLTNDQPFEVEESSLLLPPLAKGSVLQGPEMTFWSENHQILFATAQFLAGQLFPDDEFPSATTDPQQPVTGTTHMERARLRLEQWLDKRLLFGFSEWNSPGYYNEDLPPLFNLVDFCGDERIKTKAAMVIDLLLFDLARRTCRGSFGVTAGRVYWEQKCYGWEQVVGDLIEILFGSRGDIGGAEDSSIAFATSTYDVPEALLAIGKDREVLDRTRPFRDRSRISINLDESSDYGIGFVNEEDMVFWWGNGAYFTDRTLQRTKSIVEAHPNLKHSPPFNTLYKLDDPIFSPVWYDLIETLAGALVASGAGALVAFLPPPLSILPWIIYAGGVAAELEGLVNLLREIGVFLLKVGKKALHYLSFGLIDDDSPKIPESAIRQAFESLLIAFNRGSVLSRANLYTYSNGDAMLSSAQNHLPGLFAAQKQPWQASLGCDACVWTSAPLIAPEGFWDTLSSPSQMYALLDFLNSLGFFRVPFKDGLLDVHPTEAWLRLAQPELQSTLAEQLSHDGPNVWTGSVALPVVMQHENAAIIAYNLPREERAITSAIYTHAWFPKDQFDEVSDLIPAHGGTWIFARKTTYDPTDPPIPDPGNPGGFSKDPRNSGQFLKGTKTGSGFVALFSARPMEWINEQVDDPLHKDKEGNPKKIPGPWNGKELRAEGGSNIWICLIGNMETFRPPFRIPLNPQDVNEMSGEDYLEKEAFKVFINAVLHTALVIDGLNCTFEIPDPSRNRGEKPHRLEFSYDDRKAWLDKEELPLDEFPRFENRYVSDFVSPGGIHPQVLGFKDRRPGSVAWGSRRYAIEHPEGLFLLHDLGPKKNDSLAIEQVTRVSNKQTHKQVSNEQVQDLLNERRLHNGSLTTLRLPHRQMQTPKRRRHL